MNEATVRNLLGELKENAGPHFRADIRRDGAFQCVLRASLSKTVSTAVSLWREGTGDSFVSLGALRSICEDLIVLNFLLPLDSTERDELMLAMSLHTAHELLEKQRNFLKHVQSAQPVLPPEPLAKSATKAMGDIVKIRDSNRWKTQKDRALPSTKCMATSIGMTWIYDYVFAATSSIVHFEPGQLLRMGWGAENGDMQFDIEHFEGYYDKFGKFFSLLLLIGMFKTLSEAASAPVDHSIIHQLEEELMRQPRWPELVTFEEMNVKKPSEIIFILSSSLGRLSGMTSPFEWAR